METQVTFLGQGDDKENTEMVSFRCPDSLRAYVRDVAKQRRRKITEVHVDALRLSRDLAKRLEADMPRIRMVAAEEGLDVERDIAEVLALLVERGLKVRPKR